MAVTGAAVVANWLRRVGLTVFVIRLRAPADLTAASLLESSRNFERDTECWRPSDRPCTVADTRRIMFLRCYRHNICGEWFDRHCWHHFLESTCSRILRSPGPEVDHLTCCTRAEDFALSQRSRPAPDAFRKSPGSWAALSTSGTTPTARKPSRVATSGYREFCGDTPAFGTRTSVLRGSLPLLSALLEPGRDRRQCAEIHGSSQECSISAWGSTSRRPSTNRGVPRTGIDAASGKNPGLATRNLACGLSRRPGLRGTTRSASCRCTSGGSSPTMALAAMELRAMPAESVRLTTRAFID